MKARSIINSAIIFFLIFNSVRLLAHNHSIFSPNSKIISETEDSILSYLENNPVKSDSIAFLFLKKFSGKDIYAEGIANYYRGEAAYYLQNWTEASKFYNRAEECFTLSGDSTRMASACNNLGLVYYFLGKFDKAFDAFSKSLSIEVHLKNDKGIAKSYQNIGIMLEQAGQSDKALEFYHKALEIYFDLNEWQDAAGVYNNLATYYATSGEFQKAESYYLKAYDIYNKRNLTAREATVLCNIGSLMVRRRNYDEAGKILEKALVLMKSIGDKTGEISAYNQLGGVYAAKHELHHAIFLYKKADKLAIEVGSTDLRLNNIYSLYLVYKSAGLFEEALSTHELYIALKDTFVNENPVFAQGIINQELELQLAERDIQNQKALTREKLYWVAFIIIVFFAGICLLYLLRRKKMVGSKISKKKFGHWFTQSQIDTQFVYDLLLSVRRYINEGNVEMAHEQLNSTGIVLRKLFENTGQGLIPLSNEIEFLHAFLNVQKEKFRKEIGINIESDFEFKENTVLVPFMVTKPFIEIAIANGLLLEQGEPHVNIVFSKKGGLLEVTIDDNGPSMNINKTYIAENDLSGIRAKSAPEGIAPIQKLSEVYAVSDIKFEEKNNQGNGSGNRVKFSFPVITMN